MEIILIRFLHLQSSFLEYCIFISFVNFLESLAFFLKRNESIVRLFNNEINYLNESFPPKVFEGSVLEKFFFILPSCVYGFFVVEVLRGNLFYVQKWFLPIIISFVVLSLGVYLLWYFGLKKYEAYG